MDIGSLDAPGNLQRVLTWAERAVSEKAELIVFPELANSGYVPLFSREFARNLYDISEGIDGEFVTSLRKFAADKKVYIVCGLCERDPAIPGRMFNSAVLVTPDGVAGVQRKLHLPLEEQHYFTPGSAIEGYQTPIGNIGMPVCYDAGLFPEVCRVLALRGAEVVCAPFNALTKPSLGAYSSDRFKHYCVTRAVENRMFVIGANRVGTLDDMHFFGGSIIASPAGEILAEAPQHEEALIAAELSGDLLLDQRLALPVLRDRRPHLYTALTEEAK